MILSWIRGRTIGSSYRFLDLWNIKLGIGSYTAFFSAFNRARDIWSFFFIPSLICKIDIFFSNSALTFCLEAFSSYIYSYFLVLQLKLLSKSICFVFVRLISLLIASLLSFSLNLDENNSQGTHIIIAPIVLTSPEDL